MVVPTRRIVLQGATLAALPALAAACGTGGAAGTSKDTLPASPIDVQLWANGPSEEAVKAQLAGWAQVHPNIHVDLSYGKEVFDLKGTEALVAQMAGGDPPHVVKWNRPVTGSAAVKGMLTAVDDFAKRDKLDLRTRCHPAGLAEMTGP